MGAIWLFGIPCSGFFYPPRIIQKALDEEYLSDYIDDPVHWQKGYPMEELMVFYDNSGAYLMYDAQENVYCGGVECGDFYKSSLKLDAVIDRVFAQILAQKELFFRKLK